MSHTVTAITPSYIGVSESLTITGTGFGASQGGSTVTINGQAVASYTSWSDTTIVVVVHASTTSGNLIVTVSGSEQTNAGVRWVEIRDTTKRGIEDLKAQSQTLDTSPEDDRYADGRDFNDLVHLVNNLFARINDFRLTLTNGLSVTTSDVTGATTMYLTPHKGNRIALYNGRTWDVLSSDGASLALGTLTSGLNYDVFAYNNSGTLTLEFVAWTNDTSRATAITRQDGVYCKQGTLTRRWVGTFRTTSTTQTEDSATKRFLFNADNRVPRPMLVQESDDNWTYTTAAFRAANNDTANRLQFVIGLSEEPVSAQVLTMANNASAVNASVGIGLDSTTVDSSDLHGMVVNAAIYSQMQAFYRGFPGVGFHYLQWLEYSAATGTTTWYGDNANSTIYDFGISGEVMQ